MNITNEQPKENKPIKDSDINKNISDVLNQMWRDEVIHNVSGCIFEGGKYRVLTIDEINKLK